MGGAALSANVHRIVLYEPSLGLPYPPGSIDRIDAALARGDHDAAITAVLVDVLEMTDDEIDVYRASPLWPVRLAAAPTIPRECRAEEGWVYQPAALPNADVRVLDGHAHFAHSTDPAMVAEIVGRFITS